MEDKSVDQHPSGRTDLYNYISASNICDNVSNTNVPDNIIENHDVIASIEPRLKFWPNNEDPWGEHTNLPSLARSSSQPVLHSSSKSLNTQSVNTSTFPSGTTLDTTETEYTLDPVEHQNQPQTHVLRPGSSIASLSTSIDTPVQTESIGETQLSAGEVAEARKLFKNALSDYAMVNPDSTSRGNLEQDVPLDTEEEELLQNLLTVPPVETYRDAETQVTQKSNSVATHQHDNMVTEIDMPLEFQRFLKHFFMAKADSDSPIYEKDWSVSDIGTIDNLDSHKVGSSLQYCPQKVHSLSKESDVFAKIRSELGDIAFRAKESVMMETSKKPPDVKHSNNVETVDMSDDFQSKICRRLQSIALADSVPVPENLPNSNPEQEKIKEKIISKNDRLSPSVKVMVSPNYFGMRGPWLEHVLDFHSLGNTEIPSFSTADKFEFQSRTPIADAIKLVSAYSDETDLDSFLQSKTGKRKKPRRNASVQVDLGERPPTPVPVRRNQPINKTTKTPISKSKLKVPNKGSSSISQNWRNKEENEVVPKDVWKHFRRPPRSLVTDTTPDGDSVSSAESPYTERYNPILDETIGQYDGTFDLIEDEIDAQSTVSSDDENHLEIGPDESSSISDISSLSPTIEEDNDLMNSFSMILQESETSTKTDKELVADRAEWDLQGISQTGGSGNRKDPGGM